MLQQNNMVDRTIASPFEFVDPHTISEATLDRIFEIEQDMWSRWIWEYVQCKSCETIFSKLDIYGDDGPLPLPSEIRSLTVMKIEEHLWISTPSCHCCWWETQHIYDKDEYLPAMRRRYWRPESFLSLAYDDTDEIIWFMDWYLATLEEIFEDELKFHYSPELLEELKRSYNMHRDQKFLTFASIGTDDKNKSLLTTFGLLDNFFQNMDQKYNDTLALFESIIGSSTYCIFKIMWANSMDLDDDSQFTVPWSQNEEYPTDLLIHPQMVSDYRSSFKMRTRDVLLYSKRFQQSRKQVNSKVAA